MRSPAESGRLRLIVSHAEPASAALERGADLRLGRGADPVASCRRLAASQPPNSATVVMSRSRAIASDSLRGEPEQPAVADELGSSSASSSRSSAISPSHQLAELRLDPRPDAAQLADATRRTSSAIEPGWSESALRRARTHESRTGSSSAQLEQRGEEGEPVRDLRIARPRISHERILLFAEAVRPGTESTCLVPSGREASRSGSSTRR